MAPTTNSNKSDRRRAAPGEMLAHGGSGRRRVVTSIEQFARGGSSHGKGTVKALQTYRKKKEKQKIKRSAALREYRKIVQREGYSVSKHTKIEQPNSPPAPAAAETEEQQTSWKGDGKDSHDTKQPGVVGRPNRATKHDRQANDKVQDPHDDDDDGDGDDMIHQERNKRSKNQQKNDNNNKNKKKPDRFSKSLEKARQKELALQEKERRRIQNERDKKRKLRERKERTRLLTQRTRKGQPIMSNMVHDILNKLQKEQQQSQSQQQSEKHKKK